MIYCHFSLHSPLLLNKICLSFVYSVVHYSCEVLSSPYCVVCIFVEFILCQPEWYIGDRHAQTILHQLFSKVCIRQTNPCSHLLKASGVQRLEIVIELLCGLIEFSWNIFVTDRLPLNISSGGLKFSNGIQTSRPINHLCRKQNTLKWKYVTKTIYKIKNNKKKL